MEIIGRSLGLTCFEILGLSRASRVEGSGVSTLNPKPPSCSLL